MKASAKTQKRTKKQSIYKNPWIIVTIVVCVAVLAYTVLNISAILVQQKQDDLDKQKFAQIETLVNGVKTKLDQKFPQGEWYIIKYCSEGHVTFGPGPIFCDYGVETQKFNGILEPIKGILSSSELIDTGTSSDTGGSNTTYFTKTRNVACNLYFTQETPSVLTLDCSSSARTHLYPFDSNK